MGDIFGSGFTVLIYIGAFLLVLTPVVFIHEMGHFLVARWNKVDVDAFSIGFGKELIGWNDKKGTRWKICAIPLGGYVKFAGDSNAASVPDFEAASQLTDEQKAGNFLYKSVWQRAAIVVAGPLANFILAIFIFTLSFMFLGKVVSDPVVSSVQEGSAAQEAGIEAGDIIREIDGQTIKYFNEIPLIVAPRAGETMRFVIEREARKVELDIAPRETEMKDQFGNPQKIGILGISSTNEVGNFRTNKLGPIDAFSEAVTQTWYQIKIPVLYIKDIIIGRKSAEMLGGPVRIAKYSGDIASLGLISIIQFIAFISVAIGLMNLFPIPMLDGGHLMFYAIEAVRGKPLSARVQEMGYTMGLMAMLALMAFTLFNDVNFIRKFLG